MDWSPPGSSVHGILQERILEWVATPSARGSSGPRHHTCIFFFFFLSLALAGRLFISSTTWGSPYYVLIVVKIHLLS